MRALRAVVVGIAGLSGVLVLLAVLAPLVGIGVVRLATGSMAPAYPAESLLLVRDVAASEVTVGDVVTVRRPGAAPVTHRVIGAQPAGEGVRLELQGDANRTPDPGPYLVERVGLVIVGIPAGGQLVAAAQTPVAVLALSTAAALVVLWAWWPARPRPAHRAEVTA